jgi:Tol biopolymer transport system component
MIALVPFAGDEPLKLLDLPLVVKSPVLQWASDGRGLIYIDGKERVSNLWLQPLDGGRLRQLTDFKTDRIFSFAWSRDGRQLACARGVISLDVIQISDFQR